MFFFLLRPRVIASFNSDLDIPLPSSMIAEKVMKARLSLLDASAVDWNKAVAAAKGLSHADITRACEQAAKNAILEHSTAVNTDELISALEERSATHP